MEVMGMLVKVTVLSGSLLVRKGRQRAAVVTAKGMTRPVSGGWRGRGVGGELAAVI